ncbi:MAG: hypothetical protein ACKVH0_09950 [Alphaproteobacteria bacterium]
MGIGAWQLVTLLLTIAAPIIGVVTANKTRCDRRRDFARSFIMIIVFGAATRILGNYIGGGGEPSTLAVIMDFIPIIIWLVLLFWLGRIFAYRCRDAGFIPIFAYSAAIPMLSILSGIVLMLLPTATLIDPEEDPEVEKTAE